MSWKILPYKSVGSVKFGMAPNDVEKLIGKAEDVQGNPIPAKASKELRDRYANYFTEFRIGSGPETIKPSIQYKDKRVVSLEIYDTLKGVEVAEFEFFSHTKLQCLEYFTEKSRKYALTPDSLIFLDFGFAMSNDEEWEYSPSINAFAEGEFDDLIKQGVESGEVSIVTK